LYRWGWREEKGEGRKEGEERMCKKAKFVDGSNEWGREASGDCGRVAIKESGVLGLKSSRPQCQTKKFLKIQYSGGCHLENRKKLRYLSNGLTNLHEIWHGAEKLVCYSP